MINSAVKDVEALWLDQARTGDAKAFCHLVESYQIAVYNLCYRMLGDHYEAEDAAQEAFLRAYKAMGRYDRKRPFSTWLLSIAAHYCIDQIRRRRMIMVPFDKLPNNKIRDTSPNPEKSLIVSEDQLKVHRLLDTLNPKGKAAVVMRYWFDFSYEEIAEALHLTVSAVKSRLHRARRKLAQSWLDNDFQEFHPERSYHETPAL